MIELFRFKFGILLYWLLPSFYYLLDAVGLLGHTGSGFSLTLDLLEASWPYSIIAAPLGILSGYPPTWAWLAAGLVSLRRNREIGVRKTRDWIFAIASAAFFAILLNWLIATFSEPYAWTRLVLSAVTWPLVFFLLRNRNGVYNFSKTK
ncbi:MAG: hypothetical protein ACKOWI_02960 [Rhodoluna sp.]